MTKSGYPYPPDEFDVAVPGGAPVGVHRAPRSGWSSAWPFLLVAVVCAAVAWGGITLLSGGDDPAEASGGASPSVSASASASTSAPASGEPSGTASGSAPAPSSSPSTSSSAPTGITGNPANADLTAGVQVLNSGGPTGAAATAAETITAAGFTGNVIADDDTANLGEGYTETTVLYGADRADTAAAVAQAIGATTAIESADVTTSAYAVIVLIK